MKKCNECNIEKSSSEFNKFKKAPDGLQYKCKECLKKYRVKNRDKIIEYLKNYTKENKDKYQDYYQNNKDKYQDYYQNNKDKIIEYQKQWRENNPEYMKEYKKQRYSTDIEFKLHIILRARINQAIRTYNFNKKDKSMEELGCNIQEYVLHLESQFTDEMNWGNHGTYWEIDHIHPLSKGGSFYYTNTQPLTIEENRSKGSRVI